MNDSLRREIKRLRAALMEIADNPTGVGTYQAEIAKAALAQPFDPVQTDQADFPAWPQKPPSP